VLFNATNLLDAIGLFQEQVYALNFDGSIAFGQSAIWDTTTFAIHGDATKIADLPFVTSVMTFDPGAQVLYALNSADSTIYQIEPVTVRGFLTDGWQGMAWAQTTQWRLRTTTTMDTAICRNGPSTAIPRTQRQVSGWNWCPLALRRYRTLHALAAMRCSAPKTCFPHHGSRSLKCKDQEAIW